MTYRLFTNDRGSRLGIPMYSALKDVEANSPAEAVAQCPRPFQKPPLAPARAIPWPAANQSDADVRWLSKHVG